MTRPGTADRSRCKLGARLSVLAEKASWGIGLACIAGWTACYVDGITASRRMTDRFQALQAATLQQSDAPDQSLWSPGRILAWQNALKDAGPVPLAILRIPRIRFQAPVLEGTDEISLNRGVGHIEDTAQPGTEGNAGIAGHRDGFFRVLKDIASGDAIELETLHGTEMYRVERTWIVDPEDVSVLDPTPTRSLTLVTCYPFYFVGSAPRRFIVRAVFAGNASTSIRRPQRQVSHLYDGSASTGHLPLNIRESYRTGAGRGARVRVGEQFGLKFQGTGERSAQRDSATR
jgi:sortase A